MNREPWINPQAEREIERIFREAQNSAKPARFWVDVPSAAKAPKACHRWPECGCGAICEERA